MGSLLENSGCSLHDLSGTGWTDRVQNVKPFAAPFPIICAGLQQLHTMNLSNKTTREVKGAISYISSFTCILMSALWLKTLVAIDHRKQIIQAREATIDVELSNLKSLIQDLKDLRDKWGCIMNEANLAAEGMQIAPHIPEKGRLREKFFLRRNQRICHARK